MQPYPQTVVFPAARVVLDPVTQTSRWLSPEGTDLLTARHKRSETSQETSQSQAWMATPTRTRTRRKTPIDREPPGPGRLSRGGRDG
ncbi:putative ATP-grasp-modified RiPP [Streptomyces diacarni]|uniref:putative ATP-grasp-modified RiPP n=1 Tax=Streptomyces diacarni TaxID=2800381 RepID=UPI0033E0D847